VIIVQTVLSVFVYDHVSLLHSVIKFRHALQFAVLMFTRVVCFTAVFGTETQYKGIVSLYLFILSLPINDDKSKASSANSIFYKRISRDCSHAR